MITFPLLLAAPQKTKAMSRDFSREAGNLAWVTNLREWSQVTPLPGPEEVM